MYAEATVRNSPNLALEEKVRRMGIRRTRHLRCGDIWRGGERWSGTIRFA